MLKTKSRMTLSAQRKAWTTPQVWLLSLTRTMRMRVETTFMSWEMMTKMMTTTKVARWMMTGTIAASMLLFLKQMMRRKRQRRRTSTTSTSRRLMRTGCSESLARSSRIQTSALPQRKRSCPFCQSKICSSARTGLCKCCSTRISSSRSCCSRIGSRSCIVPDLDKHRQRKIRPPFSKTCATRRMRKLCWRSWTRPPRSETESETSTGTCERKCGSCSSEVLARRSAAWTTKAKPWAAEAVPRWPRNSKRSPRTCWTWTLCRLPAAVTSWPIQSASCPLAPSACRRRVSRRCT
mmetsp:Transcript_8552/g.20311  ORF Transcript_8552/g.20311 Transcript_8552/m.20311 type:complete len:293 (-) Transcript_8552:2473-3351(-)